MSIGKVVSGNEQVLLHWAVVYSDRSLATCLTENNLFNVSFSINFAI